MRQLIFLPLVLFGCSHATPPDTPLKADATAAQSAHEGDALTAEEKIVKAYILDNADDPKSVEFSRWGPNVMWADYCAAKRAAGQLTNTESEQSASMIVRARWRSANDRGVKELHDELFYIVDGQALPWLPHSGSDHWFEESKAQWAGK